ncbi:MAG: hypothetical protein KDE31_11635 [Caldilineaceae bacterium]|nr:hypothetical protein [Caldilineaceae bacterium]
MSADISYLTLGGVEKTACTTGDVAIELASGETRMHGPLSWVFGSALMHNESGARWSEILHEMVQLIHLQQINLELSFHGQPTARFSD